MENNNRFMPHIRRTTHIMMFAHRNSFDFHFFECPVVFLLRVLQHTGLSDPYVIQVYCLNNSNC